MIITLSGRRIDAEYANITRFPLEKSLLVRERIHTLLQAQHATALVSSAACGADLLALDIASELGLRRRVILPFQPERFRASSVVDRPGAWGSLFDQIIAAVDAAGDLVVLNEVAEDDATFVRTNKAILDEAQVLAHQAVSDQSGQTLESVLAVVVWDGKPRGGVDVTADFAHEARLREIPVIEIATQ